MKNVRVCYRITIRGDQGRTETYGMSLEGYDVSDDCTPEMVDANLDKQVLIDASGLNGLIFPDQMELITQEEFDAEFGDDLIVANEWPMPDA